MPITEKQLAANRANAANAVKGAGPQRRFHSSTSTLQGKARSACNARSHGFTASTFAVVRLEDLHEVAHLNADLTVVYQPVNFQELFALDRMARAQNRNYALAEGFHRIARQGNSCSLFLRYQAQSERHYRRAVEEFDRLKALRAELPNEPILEVQPKENETACAPPNEPISTLVGQRHALPVRPRHRGPLAPTKMFPPQRTHSALSFDLRRELVIPSSPCQAAAGK